MNIRGGNKIGFKVEQDIVRYSSMCQEYDYEDWFSYGRHTKRDDIHRH
jgi:hypothetical protein